MLAASTVQQINKLESSVLRTVGQNHISVKKGPTNMTLFVQLYYIIWEHLLDGLSLRLQIGFMWMRSA